MKVMIDKDGRVIGSLVNVLPENVDIYLKYPVVDIIDCTYMPDSKTTFWDGKSFCERQDYTLETLPLPCIITIEDLDYECNKQPTFEFDAPGTYKIKVDAGAAYLEKEFEIDYQP